MMDAMLAEVVKAAQRNAWEIYNWATSLLCVVVMVMAYVTTTLAERRCRK